MYRLEDETTRLFNSGIRKKNKSMSKTSPQIQTLAIVVVGRFNPAIFHPLWFSNIGIFTETDIKEAADTFGVVHPDISSFQIDWCNILVEERRFIVSTRMDAYFSRLCELVQLSFDLLTHTPVIAVGINPEADFALGSEERWHKFGHFFAPKEYWKEITESPGMQELQIKDSPRDGEFKGYTLITLCPSEKVEFGVNIKMNEHFEVGQAGSVKGTDQLLNVLEKRFQPTLEKWEEIYTHLINAVA